MSIVPEVRRKSRVAVQPLGTIEYAVQPRDTLTSIAAQFDTSTSLLKKINKLMSDFIFPDQVLFVPGSDYHQFTNSAPTSPVESKGLPTSPSAPIELPSTPQITSPGYAVRLGSSLDDGWVAPPRPLTDEEVKKIDEECHHRFVKFNADYIADGDEEVPGVLLITPDGIMFDPDEHNSLVKQKGREAFQVVESIMSVISAAIYHNKAAMKRDRKISGSGLFSPKLKITDPKQTDELKIKDDHSTFETEKTTASQSDKESQEAVEDSKQAALGVLDQIIKNIADAEIRLANTEMSFAENIKSENDFEKHPSMKADEETGVDGFVLISQDVGVDDPPRITSDLHELAPSICTVEKFPSTVASFEANQLIADSSDSDVNKVSLNKCIAHEEIDYMVNKTVLDVDNSIEQKETLEVASELANQDLNRDTNRDTNREAEQDTYRSANQNANLNANQDANLNAGPDTNPDGHRDMNINANQDTNNVDPCDMKQDSDIDHTGSIVCPKKTRPSNVDFHVCELCASTEIENLIEVENVKLENKPDAIKLKDKSDSTSDELVIPVYLCLKTHKNVDAINAFRIESSMRSHVRLEYWYCVPYDKKVDHLYAFFKRWSPSVANATDSTEFHFVELECDIEDTDSSMESTTAPRLFGQFSKDWEIVSVKEYQRLKAVSEIKKLPLPDLSELSRILEKSHIAVLICNLPAFAEGSAWYLLYSTEKHGFSLKTMYRNLAKIDMAFFLVVQDTHDEVFGALIAGPLKMSDHFYGSGESYLFTFYPEFKKYTWTGINNYFIKGCKDSLTIGAGNGKNGLWFDSDLYRGRTQTCQTFENEILTVSEDFVVKCIEVWSFG